MPLSPLRAPFPWFGGKSRAAHLIWERFGDVANYIEPFAGSLAVLLSRPTAPRIETVNDLDCNVANFWRATKADPEAVAKWADWPVNEADLHARHRWLVENLAAHREKMMRDPDYYDAKIAGWWVWGLSMWIGTGWCSPSARGNLKQQRPFLTGPGMGVHADHDSFVALQARLRRVRILCGDWMRVLGEAPRILAGMPVGIMLDPPYLQTERDPNLYSTETNVSAAVREWALSHGDEKGVRIALCGYEGEHAMPETWECVPWKSTGTREENAKRERIWFSPACLRPDKGQLALLEPGLCSTP